MKVHPAAIEARGVASRRVIPATATAPTTIRIGCSSRTVRGSTGPSHSSGTDSNGTSGANPVPPTARMNS